eukprot:scaffold15998_cov71-Phaeocystis_antarctica.AAC.2
MLLLSVSRFLIVEPADVRAYDGSVLKRAVRYPVEVEVRVLVRRRVLVLTISLCLKARSEEITQHLGVAPESIRLVTSRVYVHQVLDTLIDSVRALPAAARHTTLCREGIGCSGCCNCKCTKHASANATSHDRRPSVRV